MGKDRKTVRIPLSLFILICLTLIGMIIAFILSMKYTVGTAIKLNNYMSNVNETQTTFEQTNKTLAEIKELYESVYIGEIPSDRELENSALLGYSLGFNDKYGIYLDTTLSEQMEDTRNERLVGIGIEAVYEEGKGYYVTRTYPESPAEKAGIQPGDYIVSAEDKAITDDNREEMISTISGEAGTSVDLGVERDGEVIGITSLRDDVTSTSITCTLIDNIAYIKLYKFTDYTDEEFIEIMEDMQSKGINSFIFDVRNNTGGSADTVINMLDYLLPKGLIVRIEGKAEDDVTEYYSDKSEIVGNMVVITNGSSASASELFTKALQEYNKATVVGENTYGKGTVLSTYKLSNGGTLTLSSGLYYTLSGEAIEGVGVKPDIEVELPEDKAMILYKLDKSEDNQLQEALKILK